MSIKGQASQTHTNMVAHLHAKNISDLKGQCIVFFSKPGSAGKAAGTASITEKEVSEIFQSSLDEKLITGAALEVVTFREANLNEFRHVIVAGLGADKSRTNETIRQAAAAVTKELKSLKCSEVFVHFDGITANKKEQAEYMKAFVEGALLASYTFDILKSKKDENKTSVQLHVVAKGGKDKSLIAAFNEGTILAQAAMFTRFLGDMPGNMMTPTILADTAIEAAKGTSLKVTAWDKKRIEKERMGGFLGVAQGSDQEPRFIVMEYNGAAKTKKPVCFVGKGLTFDSGGISLKPGAKMEEMKYDMCGGAAVIGTMLAIAKLKLKINVIAYVPATENMPNGRATKPGDVHTARNGKTFEINNTDAEGRLILSDALCYASEQKPEVIFDTATLTGAIVIALGNIHTGYFTRNSALKSKIEKAAIASGELVWNMPLHDQHVKDMKGTYADLSNISYTGGAGSATAAAFLEQFVDSDIPWAHFDIAGTAWGVGSRLNYCGAKGASGVMVRTFVELAKQYV